MRSGPAGLLFAALAAAAVCFLAPPAAAADPVAFTPELWDLTNARVVEQHGRTCLTGTAFLKGVEFADGLIEVDVYVENRRSYPGVLFRVADAENYERVYLRPHRSPFYSDAVQYLPAFNGADSWQLYAGEGITAGAAFPKGQWFTLRVVVSGTRARIEVGGTPVLAVHELARGGAKGTLGLSGPMDGSAFFSNFSYRTGSQGELPEPPVADIPPGMVAEWELSQAFSTVTLDLERYPDGKQPGPIAWRKVRAAPSGIVDVSRYLRRASAAPATVFARAVVEAERSGPRKFNIGYSDAVSVFLDGRLLFSGISAYQSRDPSFLGIVGPFDSVYLPLRKGRNELLLAVTEIMGGWGFLAQDGGARVEQGGLLEAWQTERTLAVPESAAYDPERQVLYVSNYDPSDPAEDRQSLSRLALDGRVLDREWVTGLSHPTGLAVRGNRLYVVERQALTLVDVPSGTVVDRVLLPDAVFPNDVVVDAEGVAYVSDSGAHVVYRIDGERAETWLKGGDVRNPNGLALLGGDLLLGNNGDRSLKAVGLADKSVRTLARFRTGLIDGVAVGPGGDVLLTHNEGRLYRIDASGQPEKILDTTLAGIWGTNLADFAWVPERGLLVIPTFAANSVVAYSVPR